MAKELIRGNDADNQRTVDSGKLKEKEEAIRKMSEEADKRRTVVESLFPPEPLPGLIHTDNPEGRYEVWYRGLMKFKHDYLKGPAYAAHRNEINIFMKQGKEKGADSRMASQPLMAEAQAACIKWTVENAGQDSMELLGTFQNLNKRWATLTPDEPKKTL